MFHCSQRRGKAQANKTKLDESEDDVSGKIKLPSPPVGEGDGGEPNKSNSSSASERAG